MSLAMELPNIATRTSEVVYIRSPQPNRYPSGPVLLRGLWRRITIFAALIWLLSPGAGGTADLEAGRRKAEVCTPCHGPDGNSTDPTVPSLAAQPLLYTYYQLLQFREQQRQDPQMSPVATSLSDTDMQDLAAYYAVQTPVAPSSSATDAETLEAGQQLVRMHYCDSCHAPGLVGQNHIPRLAGQHYEYLLKQLRAYKAQTRPDMDGSMTMAAQPLSAEEIETLARYIAGLGPMP